MDKSELKILLNEVARKIALNEDLLTSEKKENNKIIDKAMELISFSLLNNK